MSPALPRRAPAALIALLALGACVAPPAPVRIAPSAPPPPVVVTGAGSTG